MLTPTTVARRLVVAGVIAASVLTVMSAPARAQQKRARLSTDLAEKLAAGAQSIDVIVHGKRDTATIETVARRSQVPVKRYLTNGDAVLTVMPAPARAQQKRARLSTDLAEKLAAGAQSIDVIVHGKRDTATIETVARRYQVPVKRYLTNGDAVLTVNAGQLDALQRDGTWDHLSSDPDVHGSMDITNSAIGADQVWAGVGKLPKLTGDGVTVAVIDSGIDTRHSALKDRVLASVDFTDGNGEDEYGHGTHVAGIIAGRAGRTPDTRHLQGVATGARLVSLRVLGADGSGKASKRR